MNRLFALCLAASACLAAFADADPKLSGTAIGTEKCVNYNTGAPTYTQNTAAMAHDGDLNTFLASYDRSYTWTGLDLGEPHVITRVGWAPRNDSQGPARVQLGMFQGANSPDFLDAVPIYLIPEKGTIGQLAYADVECSRAFRYVRYVGPSDARCNIAEVEFYGHQAAGDDSALYRVTNLPMVCINTVGAEEPYDKEHDITAQIIVLGSDGEEPYVLDAPGTARLRGNASMSFPKKPYRIKFDKKQRILPSAPAKAKKWTLINNYGDKTLMRNCIAFEASRLSGLAFTPFCQVVDVVLNGEYKGCYQLCDQVEVNPGRVEIDEMTPDDIEGEALTGGYFIEVDAYASEEISWFNSSYGIPVTIKSPDEDEIMPQQKAYIKSAFNHMEALAFRNKFGEDDGYRSELDMPSFLRHFIVGEFSGNTDTYWSTYFYKQRNDPKFYCGPVWDFDLAFDNDIRTYPVNSKTNFIYYYGSSAGKMADLVKRITVSDPATAGEMMVLWSTLRNNGFTAEHFNQYVDSLAAEMDASQRLNFTRWPILGQKVHQNPKTYSSYAAAVADVKSYITRRIQWLDNKIGYDPEIGTTPSVATDCAEAPTLAPGGVVMASAPCQVFDVAGRLVGTAAPGAPLRLPARGIYLARSGSACAKLAY